MFGVAGSYDTNAIPDFCVLVLACFEKNAGFTQSDKSCIEHVNFLGEAIGEVSSAWQVSLLKSFNL